MSSTFGEELIAAMKEAAAHARGKGEVARIHHAADALEKLIAAAIERDGGGHDIDCKIFRQSVRRCTCGHDALTALLEELDAKAKPSQCKKEL